jgi:hypothetical protein
MPHSSAIKNVQNSITDTECEEKKMSAFDLSEIKLLDAIFLFLGFIIMCAGATRWAMMFDEFWLFEGVLYFLIIFTGVGTCFIPGWLRRRFNP